MSTLITSDVEPLLTGTKLKLEKLLDYYIASDRGQSRIYKVASFKADVAEHGDDINTLQLKVEEALTGMYREYFDSVTVNVSGEATGINPLKVFIEVTEGDKTTTLDRAILDNTENIHHKEIQELRRWL